MTKRTPQLEATILAGFADGRSLRAMCRTLGISRVTFLTWMRDDPDLAFRYEETQFLHASALVDDCLAIADDPMIDLGEGRPGDGGMDEAERMRRARFRVDTRLKVARIHFKQHEAALARHAKEEALLLQAEAEADAKAAPAPNATNTAAPLRTVAPASNRPNDIYNSVPRTTPAAMPEPERLRATGAS